MPPDDPGFLSADDLRIDPVRLDRAKALIQSWTLDGTIPAVSVCVGRRRGCLAPWAVGRMDESSDAELVDPDTTFLVASLAKPLVAVATILLVERGGFLLDDRVVRHFPEFDRFGKDEVCIRHLLTHTSGLPDMLPDNVALRERHASLTEFLEAAARVPLLFPPGTQVRYQSVGFLVLAELIRRISGQSLGDFLRDEVFVPLGLTATRLGISSADDLRRRATIRLGPEASATSWHWNSPYWLAMGAPWGGLVTTASDYGRFLRAMLRGGEIDGVRILSQASAAAMVENQLQAIPGLSEESAKRDPWGFGWRLRPPGRSSFFGDLVGPKMFGHWGSTGTLAWADPDLDAFAVILTTLPQDPEGRYLAMASNALAAIFEDS